ncbi:MAG: stage III sporulation protein AG [Lachnospiraceae bacterium]
MTDHLFKNWKKPGKEQLLIGVLIGVLLLVIAVPVDHKKDQTKAVSENIRTDAVNVQEQDMEQRLSEILSKISGVGETQVLITYADSGEKIVEKDGEERSTMIRETDSSGGSRITTEEEIAEQTIYGNDEDPFVVREKLPRIEGILIVAQGGGNAEVKEKISRAVQALFGLEAHKISIMKMEVSK